MTIIGELGIVYGVTGASVLGIKLLKERSLPSRLVATCGSQMLINWECLVCANGYTRCGSGAKTSGQLQ
ncbi:hypothetical protein [Bacillus pseudomycoides]|uniref:hypothetical protein n=1 Tax=Bacillus pseudomycoides TaxID=64104 RepID=UPI001FB1FE19|nr:hypothetical protein [Bacillus pseudomycoides]